MNGNNDWGWLSSLFQGGAGAGTMGKGLWDIFGTQKNPADAANNSIGQIPGAVSPYYNPYIDAGKGAMGDLQNQYKDLLGGDVQNKLGESYKESPGYKFKMQQAMDAARHAAAGGGMAGTPMHQQNSMQLANDIASQDYNDYMKNQTDLYGRGLSGEQDIFGKGYGASGDMANSVGNSLSQQGAYNYAGQAGQNQSKSSGWGNLFSGLGMLSEWFK